MFAAVGSNIWPCAFWASGPLEPPVTISSTGPRNVLILENLRDPATPLPLARDIRGSLGMRASLVTVDEGGHGVLTNSDQNICAAQLASSFLKPERSPPTRHVRPTHRTPPHRPTRHGQTPSLDSRHR